MSNKEESNETIPFIPYSNLNIQQFIGKGNYGNVFKAQWKETQVAFKKLYIEKLTNDLFQDFQREATAIYKCQHPNILRFFAISVEDEKGILVMEYLERGSLFEYLRDSRIQIEWNSRWNIASDIAKGLKYLHDQNILHQDLKSTNVLVQNDWKAKLTDFGMSKIKLAIESRESMERSIRWKSPELCRMGSTPTKSSDVYSLGMVFWEIASRKLPFQEESRESLILNYIKNGGKEKIPENSPPSFSNIIQECWADAFVRLDAESIVLKLESSSFENVEQETKNDVPSDMKFWTVHPEAKISDDGRTISCSKVTSGQGFYINPVGQGKHHWTFEIQLGEGTMVLNIRDDKIVKGSPFDYYSVGVSYANFGSVHRDGRWSSYGERFQTDSTIDLLFDSSTGEVSFLLNGNHLGVAGVLPKCESYAVGWLLYNSCRVTLINYSNIL